MLDTIIQVENLGKKYKLRHQAQRGYRTLRESIMGRAKGLFKKRPPENGNGNSVEEFWALQGVSFEVKRGDVVGIIGRNGAGKSTLLKILSRITVPTTGRIRISGRVASLLEVGTGFHPELTGRENIFLNGAVLGMTGAEIRSKFDEIVAFAEVEKFLDTPVKRYSSGLYVRLAFAVAAHLEPEILIVDEVLAVGDAQFQKKCLGKMQDVSRSGRTVLFVSHNLSTVQTLCKTGILLERGRVRCHSNAQEALRAYSESTNKLDSIEFPANNSRPSITSVRLQSSELESGNLVVDIGFKSPFPLNCPVAGLVVYSILGTPIFGSNPRFHKSHFEQQKLSEGILRMAARGLPVHGGTYKLSVWLGDWHTDYDERRDVLSFEFKGGRAVANMPNPETIGFIDTSADWSLLENNL